MSLSYAQDTPERAARPMITNGDFSRFSSKQNLWDGVDSSGFLAVPRAELPLLREDGSVGTTPVPPSVAVGDLNGDGLQDLLVTSPMGYMFAYFNSGTAEEPKFTNAELVPVFLGIPDAADDTAGFWNMIRVRGQRASLAPIYSGNQLDIIFGNYAGSVYYLRNTGSASRPVFAQPRNLADIRVPLFSGSRIWANLVAPIAFDMTGNRNLDLLVGEGSYSANSIHFFENKGSSASPKFSENDRHFIVYGEGREQLAPAVVDWNGDGRPDILVGDRRGELSIHLHPGQGWKPGEVFPLTSLVTLGSSSRLGSAIIPAAGDMNGDGRFDILLGRINGRISMAINSGTLGEPKFETPTDLRGEDTGLGVFKNPRGWHTHLSKYQQDTMARGNAYSFVAAVDVKDDPALEPQSGTHVLKAGYHPPGNSIFPAMNYLNATTRSGPQLSNRMFRITTSSSIPLEVGKGYTLRFKVRGEGVRNAQWRLDYRGRAVQEEGRLVIGSRGAATRVGREEVGEDNHFTSNFNAPGNWTQITGSLQPQFKDRRLSALKTVSSAYLYFQFELPEHSHFIYIDDVEIIAN